MTVPRRTRGLVAAAFVAAFAGPWLARAADGPDEAALRAALDRAFAAAERDHGKARSGTATKDAAAFATAVGDAVRALPAADAADRAKAIADAAAALAARSDAVVSETTLRALLLAARPAEWPKDAAAGFAAALAALFDAERFEDCWDAHFLSLPEVEAWRAAKARSAAPAPPPDAAEPKPEPGTEPKPEPPRSDLPAPDAEDPLANLVPVDRGRGWVGPWTGWVQEIPERDNRRQKRPAKAVWIDRYEVTCAEYLRFLRSVDPSKRRALLPVGWSVGEGDTPACPPGRERTPVTGVTFLQASEYAAAVGKRLPTEDEWERAAGGGDKDGRAFPWGADAAGKSWVFGAGFDAPAAVDDHPDDRTPEGVVGLAGNVAELVATQPDRRDLPSKVAPNLEVVLRGGSWRTSREADCGTGFRWVIEAGQSAPHVGSRCVMDEAEFRRRSR